MALATSRLAPAGMDAADRILAEARRAGAAALDEARGKTLLASLGIAVPRGVRIAADDDVAAALAALQPPFALKGLAEVSMHKSDIGAVRLGLADASAVDAARAAIAAAAKKAGVELTGFLVEEMAAPGTELVIGGTIDGQLGPMLMVGAGGIFAEILDDIAFRLCPIERVDAEEMLADLRMYPILAGARGRAPADLEAVIAALLKLGGEDGIFTTRAGEIAEFDLNPVLVSPDGVLALDARFVLAEPGR